MLALMLRDEVKDPRIGMITIIDVEVSRDLAHARVYFTTLGDDEAIQASQIGLESASGFLRRELGRRMKIRTVPELHFVYDTTQQKADRVDVLIEHALSKHRSDEKTQKDS